MLQSVQTWMFFFLASAFAWQQSQASKLPEHNVADTMMRASSASSQRITIIANLSMPVYPPLVNKWGGVEHWDAIAGTDIQSMTANFQRKTPMVLGVVQMGTTMSNDTAPYFARGHPGGPVTVILNASRQALRQQRGTTHPHTHPLTFMLTLMLALTLTLIPSH